MGKNKGYRSMMTAIFCGIIVILMPVCIFLGTRKTIDCRINGTEVEAEVTAVTRIGRTRQVEAIYYDSNGALHICETVYNGIPNVGDRFTGYTDPDDPDKLYRMPSTVLLIVFGTVYAALLLVSLISLFRSIRIHRENRLLSERGTLVKGRIVSVNRRSKFVYDCFANFTDDEGTTQTVMVTFSKSIPAPDTECSLVYYRTPKGRLICDLIEL